ncbi:MAG: phospholipase D-like domain-containing protein [Propylenella sp.]
MRTLTDDSTPASQSHIEPAQAPILQPGRNCCSVSTARRAAVLIDAADYFACLETVLREARRSILILGWDFDAATRLRPDHDGSPPFGDLLRSLVEERPELVVRILVWNLATIHAPGETLPLIFGAEWHNHPRIQLWLDHNHPIYGAQHQKLVCIDDGIAFVGGIDLTIDRWDTNLHAPEDTRRRHPDGTMHGPTHDLQMVIEGDAARAVASVARHRWKQATGEELTERAAESDLWPADFEPDFTDVPVAVSRAIPASGSEPQVREIKALVEDILGAAKRSIYIEAQYFADPRVADLLAASLAEQDGPEIVAVVPHSDHGWLEKLVMGVNRDRMIRRLKQADRHGRFGAFFPVVLAPGGDCEIFVHSKLMIVDDRLLRIGSANLNRRSTGLDTECDLAIEASDPVTREAVARIRSTLLAEHLGVTLHEVDRQMERRGSLLGAMGALSGHGRTLRPFDSIRRKGPTRPLFGTRLLDPGKPFSLISLFRRSRPHRHVSARPRRPFRSRGTR